MSILHTNKTIFAGIKGILFLFLVFQIISPAGFAYAQSPDFSQIKNQLQTDPKKADDVTNAIERGLRESTVSAEPEECDLTDIACGILRAGNYVLDKFMMVGFDFGKRAVASAIDENKTLSAAIQQDFVKTGWPFVRVFANFFFV